LDCFKYLLQNGCDWWFNDGFKSFGSLLECFEWAHINNVNMYQDQQPGVAASNAAKLGDLDCLKWLHDNDFELDEETCEAAASEGYLHILQWAIANGCDWDERTCSAATGSGHLHILQWALENRCPWDKKKCLNLAQQRYNEEMIKFIESFEN